MKISLAPVQRPRISVSVRFTCLPGRLPRTSSSFVMTSSTSNEELAIAPLSDDEPAVEDQDPLRGAFAPVGSARSAHRRSRLQPAPASMLRRLSRRLLLHGARRHLAFGRPPPPAPPPPDPLPELVLGTVIAANLAVFGIWHDRRWQPWMERHFVLSLGGLMHERRWHTMVTNAFSQLQPGHLFANSKSRLLPPAATCEHQPPPCEAASECWLACSVLMLGVRPRAAAPARHRRFCGALPLGLAL